MEDKQIVTTPPTSDCYCGAKAHAIDWNYNDMWQVMCDNNHTLTRQCGTKHRAICRWNNRVREVS